MPSLAPAEEQQQQQQQQQHLPTASPSSSPSSSQNESSFSIPSPPKNMPASLSNPTSEKHPKGKRKRTATKDKVILEEAYSINPKPDKQARLEIVNRVSLNEKEVQIWFQNRRQNDRRKSRPLSPQELAALRFGAMHTVSSDPATSQPFLVKHDKTPFSSCDSPQSQPQPQPQSQPSSQSSSEPAPQPALQHAPQAVIARPPPSPKAPLSPEQPQSRTDAIHATPRWTSSQGPNDGRPTQVTPQRRITSPFHETQSFSASVGYIANRWNAATFSTPVTAPRDGSFRFEPIPPSSCSSVKTTQSQSQMRLSLSLEGKAKVVANDASPVWETPSRPSSTLPSLSQNRLQRSHSTASAITLPPISSLTKSLPQLGHGRSRDVHAWELCADADVQDELTAQAERESNGSAIAEISLLRSACSVLQPSGAKRNAPISRTTPCHSVKKLKLGRAHSSAARLENILGDGESPRRTPAGKCDVSMLVSPTDSDKENWSPSLKDRITEEHQRQQDHEQKQHQAHDLHQYRVDEPSASPLRSHNPRRMELFLEDQQSPSRTSGREPSEPRTFSKGFEMLHDLVRKTEACREDDVSKFMRGDLSPSKRGDMDCVAGLLSLSQGAWR